VTMIDDILPFVPEMRRQVESLMVDVCVIYRPGAETFDANTGQTSSTPTTVHTGPCRLRMPSTAESTSIFGDREVTKLRFVVDVPHDVTGIELEDYISITESDDASALARTFQVAALPSETFNFYRPIGCEVVEA